MKRAIPWTILAWIVVWAVCILLSGCTAEEIDWMGDFTERYYTPPITTSCNTHGTHTTCQSW
jgi:predicted small secreted protein